MSLSHEKHLVEMDSSASKPTHRKSSLDIGSLFMTPPKDLKTARDTKKPAQVLNLVPVGCHCALQFRFVSFTSQMSFPDNFEGHFIHQDNTLFTVQGEKRVECQRF
ncbi:hypothetical protein PMIN01_05013 [Paraphaeosphaeria minitans]|uniref:Uncharacterized protein n=1 Tax=Paraphaeosphaeria minitans TaxID=565426 RepID=A0A9P6GKS8_9PLEO|nr:hypothetical protein PMIN01_05013 [Paraphaeosphaeria minitans]